MSSSAENQYSSLENAINSEFTNSFAYDPSNFNEAILGENIQRYDKIYSVDTSVLLIDPFAIFYLTGNKIPKELQSQFSNKYGLNISYDVSGEPNNFVLSQIVEKELDKIKDNHRRDTFVRFMARRALELIRYFYQIGRGNGENPREGITLENGAKFIYLAHDEVRFQKEYAKYFEPDNDVRIIYDILTVNEFKRSDQSLIVVTQDGGFVNKAEAIGVNFKLENYKREQISRYESIYSGKQVLKVVDNNIKTKYSKIDVIFKKDLSDILSDFGINPDLIHPNMVLKFEPSIYIDEPWKNYLFVTGDAKHFRGAVNFVQYLRDCEELEKNAHVNYFSNTKEHILLDVDKAVHKLNKIKNKIKKRKSKSIDKRKLMEIIANEFSVSKCYDFSEDSEVFYSVQEMFARFPFHRNIKPEKDQIPYFELLLSKEIPVVSVIGEQGAGKSVLALLTGIYQVWKGYYERISYIRSTREMGTTSIGFLPGTESDKMEPWKRSVRDNLMDIFYDKERRGDLYYKKQVEDFIYNLEKIGLIEFLTPQFLQGRTLNDRFIIVDEAQNFPRTVASIILGRTGETSKMVFLGDPKQLDAIQYSDRFVNKYNTGIIHIAERLKELPVTAHITLPLNFNKRSEASKAATLL